MIAYVDSSVILRLILGQSDAFAKWSEVEHGVSSEIAEVECLRTIDRLRQVENLSVEQVGALREAAYRVLDSLEIVRISRAVLARAGQPLSMPLGTLDALHLVTALLWTETIDGDLVMLTHDRALAAAARASGLRVKGA